ncbi:hypothetical protein [Parapedobacter sp.]|nr:hypothetical protein [Parapedobacter sp.]
MIITLTGFSRWVQQLDMPPVKQLTNHQLAHPDGNLTLLGTER